MYSTQALLPAVTNRESVRLPIAVIDDDTGQPVNLSGTTGVGSFSGWAVTTPNASVVFAGALTIATGTLNLALSAGLNIIPGDSISLVLQSDNTKTMIGAVQSYNAATGALVAQIGYTVAFEVRRAGNPVQITDTYQPWWDYGAVQSGPVVVLSVGNGISFPDVGQIQVDITVAQMRTLDRATYNVGCVITSADGTEARELFIGRLPVLSGYVT